MKKISAALILAVALLTACEDEAPAPVPDMLIGGKAFHAEELYMEEPDSTGLRIHFQAGNESVEIQTSDIIPGRYLFQKEYFKSVVYPARLIYMKLDDTYLSVSGKLDLEYDDGVYSGIFETVVQDPDSFRVVITEGVFQDL